MTNEPWEVNEQPFVGIELADVVVQSFSAALKRLDSVEHLQLKIVTSWATGDDTLLCRFSAECRLYDSEVEEQNEEAADNHLLAKLRCRIVCAYDVAEESREALLNSGADVIRSFAERVALPTAYPYIREAISSMSTRLGFPRVTIGVFRPDDMTFASRPL